MPIDHSIYKMSPEERVRELVRMREKALHDEASLIDQARKCGFVEGFTETFTKVYIKYHKEIFAEDFAEDLKKSLDKSFKETYGTNDLKYYEEKMFSGMRLAGISEDQIEAARKAMLKRDN